MAVQRLRGWFFVASMRGATRLDVAVQREGLDGFRRRQFAKRREPGTGQLEAWLQQLGAGARVALEASGVYSLDVALALDEAGVEVAVLNPRKANDFARSLNRSKTDKADAEALSEHSRRMEFVRWRRPSREALELRALGRHMATLTEEHSRLSNRLHAAEGSRTAPRCVREDLKRSMAGIKKRLLRLQREARTMIEREAEMKRSCCAWWPCRVSEKSARCRSWPSWRGWTNR